MPALFSMASRPARPLLRGVSGARLGIALTVFTLLLGILPSPVGATLPNAPTASIVPAGCHDPCAHPAASGAPAPTGLSWVRLRHPSADPPSPRESAAMAYDAGAQGVLLFGGCGPAQCPMGDTWWYDSGTWTNLSANLSIAPPARYGAAMAYDASSGGVLLFGGCTASGVLGDTWLFLDGAWSALATNGSNPSPRCLAASASYPPAEGVALFGGSSSNGSDSSDLWIFANATWTGLAPAGGILPPARHAAGLTYDPSEGLLQLFGGTDARGIPLGDTWAFHALLWQNLSSPARSVLDPGPRGSASFGYDPGLGGSVLFGGTAGPALFGDTWLLAHGSWSNISDAVSHPPAPHAAAATAYDAADGYLLIEGGRTPSSGVRNDTWAFVLPLTAGINFPYASIAPLELVRLTASVSGGFPPYRYNWTFGDGTPALRLVSPTHGYALAGSYRVGLVVQDAHQGQYETNLSILVGLAPLTVSLSVTPVTAPAGSRISVSAAPRGGVPPYTIGWSGLPAGCAGNGSGPFECTTATAGSFLISAVARDSAGTSARAQTTLTVLALTTTASSAAPFNPIAALYHFGWLLVPPLAVATLLSMYASYASYLAVRNAGDGPPAAPRPECYVPPEWSETPADFGGPRAGPSSDPRDGAR